MAIRITATDVLRVLENGRFIKQLESGVQFQRDGERMDKKEFYRDVAYLTIFSAYAKNDTLDFSFSQDAVSTIESWADICTKLHKEAESFIN